MQKIMQKRTKKQFIFSGRTIGTSFQSLNISIVYSVNEMLVMDQAIISEDVENIRYLCETFHNRRLSI